MYVPTHTRPGFRGFGATEVGGGIVVIPGFNNQTGKYIWQAGDVGWTVARKFNRLSPYTEWKNMRAVNPQTWGRPNEDKWGWIVNVGEEVNVPPQWLADIGWSGTVAPPPGTVSPTTTEVVIEGGKVIPTTGSGTSAGAGTQGGGVVPAQASAMSKYGVYALAVVGGLAIAAVMVLRRRRPASAARRSSRPALPARRSSRSRTSSRSRR